MWLRDSSGKEIRLMRCSVTSRPSMAAKIKANYPLYMVSIDLEEAVDQVPQDVI